MITDLEALNSVDHEHKCTREKEMASREAEAAETMQNAYLVVGVANSELTIQITPTTEHLECTTRIELQLCNHWRMMQYLLGIRGARERGVTIEFSVSMAAWNSPQHSCLTAPCCSLHSSCNCAP